MKKSGCWFQVYNGAYLQGTFWGKSRDELSSHLKRKQVTFTRISKLR